MARPKWYDMQPDPEASLARVDPYAGLAAGVLARAAKEARAGDVGACEWLAGDVAEIFTATLGIDRCSILERVAEWRARPAGKIVVRLFAEA